MGFPALYVSVHSIKVISADAPGGLGNPVHLMIKGVDSDSHITLHVATPEYADRLADAINGAVKINGSKVTP